MDRSIAALIGAAALTTVTAAPAVSAPGSELAPATNYRELLDPVPNALSALKADDTQETAVVRKAQYHHHHHRYFRRRHHHHHHHHHYF